ncbi:MAG TPA: carboxylating nicotinate-nucleotide diphosphorylase [Methylophilaceae bacterium]|nr:carboxylating nicotinate-nucleotide diphosphorylase [Methylophilaceae bacterium]
MQAVLSASSKSALDQLAIDSAVRRALDEDIGAADLTAELVPPAQMACASIVCREPAVICGLPWVESCFRQLAANTQIDWQVAEGEQVMAGRILCRITGSARALLTAERCALNFLQTLSATATLTRRYVDAVAGTGTQIMDTRKTLPGLRLAQKYAVVMGGGVNQRLGLDDGILIKENHIAAAGSIEAVLQAARRISAEVPVQIEVETLTELKSALAAGANLILLDNFTLAQLREAVAINAGRALLEASGNIHLDNVREVALTGVDRISIGSLTKNVQAIDLSMRFAAAFSPDE